MYFLRRFLIRTPWATETHLCLCKYRLLQCHFYFTIQSKRTKKKSKSEQDENGVQQKLYNTNNENKTEKTIKMKSETLFILFCSVSARFFFSRRIWEEALLFLVSSGSGSWWVSMGETLPVNVRNHHDDDIDDELRSMRCQSISSPEKELLWKCIFAHTTVHKHFPIHFSIDCRQNGGKLRTRTMRSNRKTWKQETTARFANQTFIGCARESRRCWANAGRETGKGMKRTKCLL